MASTGIARRRGALTTAATLGLVGWFWATVGASHPNEVFERVRNADRTGVLLPNWRFFAPTPANTDYDVLYRVRRTGGEVSQWAYVSEPVQRTWLHTVWFPERRRSKALIDLVTSLLQVVPALALRGRLHGTVLEHHPHVQAIHNFTAAAVAREHAGEQVEGFQFAIVEHAGYDETALEEPRFLFVSSLHPVSAEAERARSHSSGSEAA